MPFVPLGSTMGPIFIHIKKSLSNGNQFSHLLDWYAHATHCHNVIAIGISQAREHNQPSPLIFFVKLSPESISLSKYQTGTDDYIVDTACPDKTRSATSVNQSNCIDIISIVCQYCNCLYPILQEK